ncbi:cellulose biosynthesis protein BcsE [Vibrio sp. AND4]|uniref:cellulose biosynthesis protein BcsE n=1 Tax=Vibrio sp. AND4 TaxID=314289 RepID=UPI0030DD038C
MSAISSQREIKSTYVNLLSNKRVTIDLLIDSACNTESNLLICFSDKASFLSGLDDNTLFKFNNLSLNHLNKIFFINNRSSKKQPNPTFLAKDLQKIKVAENSHFHLIIPDSILAQCEGNNMRQFLEQLKTLSSQAASVINVYIYGHLATSVLKPRLLKNNHFISGLASMIALDESRYGYFVDFWSNKHGVVSGEEYILSHDGADRLTASPYKKTQTSEWTEDKADSERIYICREAIGESTNVPKEMHIAENNQSLISMLDNPRASTLIFSCSDQTEVQQLAMDCYQLRMTAGRQLKIIIRETQQCLRYADEKFLLRAGVNLISPVQVPQMRFMTQLEAIQGQMLTRALPQSLDALLKYDVKFGSKGYLNNNEFAQYCSDAIASSTRSNVNFSLIKLNLLPGMSAEECLRLCHVRRDGDVVTACKKALYVLFSAIRQNDIEVALNNIFEFPTRDLFHSTHRFETQYDIESEIKYIMADKVVISEEVSHLTTEKRIFSASKQPSNKIPTLFAVRKAIKLKGQA